MVLEVDAAAEDIQSLCDALILFSRESTGLPSAPITTFFFFFLLGGIEEDAEPEREGEYASVIFWRSCLDLCGPLSSWSSFRCTSPLTVAATACRSKGPGSDRTDRHL